QQAEKLHYPYYVVIIDEMPSSLMNSINNDEEEATARAIDGLAADWQSQFPSFDAGKSSIFLLSYSPRQYRFLAGAAWKSNLGFVKNAHRPYTEIFDRSVQGTPKDPKTGIIEMMKAIDNYLFSKTDPTLIAARKAAIEKAAKAQRLEEAQTNLDDQIQLMEGLLSKPKTYLPANVNDYRSILDNAEKIRINGDADALNAQSGILADKSLTLQQYVNKQITNEKQRQVQHGLIVTFIFLLSFIFLLFLIFRLRNLSKLKKTLDDTASSWEVKLLNAKSKYADFYGNERDRVAGLSSMTGETKELYDKVTAEVDAVYLGVEAMDSHVAGCRMMTSGASLFNLNPLKRAINSLENEFEFDTGQLDPGNLFGPPTKIIEMKPTDFANDLDNRYASTIVEWENLKMAAAIRFKSAEEIFPDNKLDDMINTADEYAIPHLWLRDHPLFGSDEEDQAVYNKVNTNRTDDPVAFIRRIDDLVAIENNISDRLKALVDAIDMVKAAHLNEVPAIGVTILSPQDDPRITFNSAKIQEDLFYRLISNPKDTFSIDEIKSQAEAIRILYQTTIDQSKIINDAINNASREIDHLKTELQNADALSINAESRLQNAQRTHSNTTSACTSLNNGCQFLESSQHQFEKAQLNLNENRHLEAHVSILEATKQLNEALDRFKLCIAQCDELDKQKLMYEEKMAKMDEARRKASSQIQHYGRRRTLGDVPNYNTTGPLDYFLMLTVLDRLEQDWNSQVRSAQREYNAEQSRIQAEREEARRRDDRSSGGWGSGWGGGSSSSSGGSWGGGSSSHGGSSSSSSGGKW
ncbi:MAG: hypothetical protein ACYC0V_06995, partial [Armatimonadota bacterium]